MTQPQQTQQAERRIVELLAAALAAGASIDALATLLMAVPGVTGKVARAVVKTSYLHVRVRHDKSRTTARSVMRGSLPRYSAWYLVNAAKRVTHGVQGGATLTEALGAERNYARAHVAMQQKRRQVAAHVDETTAATGSTLLGWVARDDERTSPECRAAGGHNFDAATPPVIGYPGAVHPRCRCFAGPAYPGAKTVDQALSGRVLREH